MSIDGAGRFSFRDRRVCIVGNGPLDEGVVGAGIDCSEIVVRFNDPPPDGARGLRTDLYVTTLRKEVTTSPTTFRSQGARIITHGGAKTEQKLLADEDWTETAQRLEPLIGCYPTSGLLVFAKALLDGARHVRLVGMPLSMSLSRSSNWRERFAPPHYYHSWLGERRAVRTMLALAQQRGIPVSLPKALRLAVGPEWIAKRFCRHSYYTPLHLPLAVVVTTHNRPDLLAARALASIRAQCTAPRWVIVGDDSDEAASAATAQAVDVFRESIATEWPKCQVILVHNERSRGLSGNANHSLLWLAEQAPDAVVAILDDDDRWHPEYLACVQAEFAKGADVTVAKLVERNARGESKPHSSYPHMHADDFLFTNRNMQGSNTAARLALLLEAGGYDEELRSRTDRDLNIRLLDLAGRSLRVIERPLVDWYRDAGHASLSTPSSSTQQQAIPRFWRKWQHRMTADQKKEERERSRELFGIDPLTTQASPTVPAPVCVVVNEGQRIDVGAAGRGTISMDIGVPALENGGVEGFIRDVATLLPDPRLTRLRLLVACDNVTFNALAKDLAAVSAVGVEVHRQDLAEKPPRLPYASIAANRQKLHEALLALPGKPADVAWLADEDLRLDADLEQPGTGCTNRRRIDLIGRLLLAKARGCDAVVGAYTGAAPIPAIATVRLQMLDLLRSLELLANLQPDDPWPDMTAEHANLRGQYPDYYYDLTDRHTAHLEHAMLPVPPRAGASAREVLQVLAQGASGLFDGVPLTRPLVFDDPKTPEEFHRRCIAAENCGGVTFIFNRRLLQLPVTVPHLARRDTRRGDKLWLLRARHMLGARIEFAPIPLHQTREQITGMKKHLSEAAIATNKVRDDVAGYAVTAALERLLKARQAAGGNMDAPLTPPEAEQAWRDFCSARTKRLTRLVANTARVRGLARSMERFFFLDREPARMRHYWWLFDQAGSQAANQLAEVLRAMQSAYREEVPRLVESKLRDVTFDELIDWIASKALKVE